MNHASSSAQLEEDIGHVVAVVGTRGWQCRLCSTTFPRAISIDHHMMASHHPYPHPHPHPHPHAPQPSTSTFNPAASSQDPGSVTQPSPALPPTGHVALNQDPCPVTQDVSTAGGRDRAGVGVAGCDRAGVGVADSAAGLLGSSSAEPMEGVRCAPVGCAPVGSEAGADRSSHAGGGNKMVGGSFPVKVEPSEISADVTGNQLAAAAAAATVAAAAAAAVAAAAISSESTFERQDARSTVEATMSSRQASGNLNARVETIPSHHSVQDMNSAGGCLPCSFADGDHMPGSCSHARRHRMLKAPNSQKPCKWRTCCGQLFDSKKEFKNHGRVVHNVCKYRTFVCPICSAVFQHKRGLNRHLKEKGEVPFACGQCSQQFHDQTSLTEHRKVCCSSKIQDPVSSSAGGRIDDGADQTQHAAVSDMMTSHQGTPDSFPWECSKCKKHFGDKNSFRRHLKECGIFSFKEGRRHFTCNLCGVVLPNLVTYHQHYVHQHKLAWLGEHAHSPAHSSPFLGNSPVPSPVPSVTSEINTAMAGVSLDQSRALEPTECPPSPGSSTLDLGAGTGLEEDHEQSGCRDAGRLASTPQTTTTGYSDSDLGASAASSAPLLFLGTKAFGSLTPATDSSGPVSQATATSDPQSLVSTSGSSDPRSLLSDPQSLVSTSGSSDPRSLLSDPQSLVSTSGSSDPRSLLSELSSFCPISLGSTASSGQTSEVESVVISDGEDSPRSSDSSSDSDEGWEILMDQNEDEPEEGWREKGTGPAGSADDKPAHKEGHFPWGDFHHQHHPPPPPPHHDHPFPPPPPPPPHHDHPFPPPPFFSEHFGPGFGHFPPFFHHPRFPFRGGFRGGGMRGGFCRPPFFGAERFCPPGCFSEEDSSSDRPRKSDHAAPTWSSSGEAGASSGPTGTAGPSQASSNSQHGEAAQDQDQSSAFSHAAAFCKWAGKWKKDVPHCKVMGMKMMLMMKSRLLVCPESECFQTFTEESELDKHCLESHPASKEYVCFICQQPHSQPVAFIRHVREHCDVWFHMRGRGRGRGCGRGMGGWGRRFFKHFWKAGSPYGNPYDPFSGPHSQGSGQQESDKDAHSPDLSSSKDFKECPVCKKKYRANSRENFFERHVNSHYGVEVYTFKCEECGKKFLEKGKFTAHQAKHKSSPHACQECGKAYQSKTSLTRHQRTHTGERPHKCPDCAEGFIELRELERHRRKHTGKDPFQCTVCQRGFTLKDSLLNHIRKKHPEESPVLCSRRAVPLAEVDHTLHSRPQRDRADPPSQAQAQAPIRVKVEDPDSQEPSVMELD